jgi:hypothetical protein
MFFLHLMERKSSASSYNSVLLFKQCGDTTGQEIDTVKFKALEGFCLKMMYVSMYTDVDLKKLVFKKKRDILWQ